MVFELSEAEKRIGYSFKDKELLRKAFTHSSYSNEKNVSSNERLEFLGDSVLNFVITDIIYRQYPDKSEGELTRIRASYVSAKEIYAATEKLNLKELMLLGEGEKKNENLSPNISVDLFEAIIGAIFIDGGISSAVKFITTALNIQLNKAKSRNNLDYKSRLSETSQKIYGKAVNYVTLKQEGLPHRPLFTMGAVVNGVTYEGAPAESKKKAQQFAAKIALEKISVKKTKK
jgi:ribonuclease-3